MFQSVLNCALYARSRRSISFWYLSIENGGGVKSSRPCSAAKRAYIARIISWISVACAAAREKSARTVPKKSPIAARMPLVNGLASIPSPRPFRGAAQRLVPDAVEQRVVWSVSTVRSAV